ncbi:MAG: C-GCAxxG-C-C family protein [Proteobacteria bacterium]|nr:C-GCAxxG-C-C family protein [Pseudomonadota bacterium]MBU1596430.1 C-GCAxxG-C-C family protein [Pseudomonadota bacterium]
MDRKQVEQRTEELFRGGLHCAEAVLQALLESRAGGAEVSPRMATAFGGGVGRSKKELCGALAGGLMALGHLGGRNAPDEPWDGIAATAASLRARFEAGYGTTACGLVLERLGPQESMDKCIRLAAHTAGMIHEALDQPASAGTAAACGCTARQATCGGAPANSGGCCG